MKMKGYLSIVTTIFVLTMNGCDEGAQKASENKQESLLFYQPIGDVTNGRLSPLEDPTGTVGIVDLSGQAIDGILNFTDPYFVNSYVSSMAADFDKRVLYLVVTNYASWNKYTIVKMGFDGSELTELYDFDDIYGIHHGDDEHTSPTGLTINPNTGKLYWSINRYRNHQYDPPQIISASLDGDISSVQVLVSDDINGTNSEDFRRLEVDLNSNKIYFLGQYGDMSGIWQKNLDDETNPSIIIEQEADQALIQDFDVDVLHNKICFNTYSDIYARSYSGNESPKLIYSVQPNDIGDHHWIRCLTVDRKNNRIFWDEDADHYYEGLEPRLMMRKNDMPVKIIADKFYVAPYDLLYFEY